MIVNNTENQSYKKLIQEKKDLWTIPNLMGYFRLLLVPVYLIICAYAQESKDYVWAAAVLAISGLTDLFDGKIARKYNMITEFGKVLDPVADKVTQAAVAVSLVYRYPMMKYLLILFIVKEGFMAVMGMRMLKKGKMMDGAQWYGKVSTAGFYVLMVILLFDLKIPYVGAELLIGFCFLLMLFSFVVYIRFYVKMAKNLSRECRCTEP